jgi:hypothetical protein
VTLDWQPQLDDLDTIVAHALAWERKLQASARPPAQLRGERRFRLKRPRL